MNTPKTGVWLTVMILLLGTALAGSVCADSLEYLQYDARISGSQINHFSDEGQPVTVVVGQFALAVGQRHVSGDKAVIWINRPADDKRNRHILTIYIEGDARVVDTDGATTTDKLMLVKLHVQGRLTMDATQRESTDPLTAMPFYRRAVAVRRKEQAAQAAWRARAMQQGIVPRDPAVMVRPSAPPRPKRTEDPEQVVGLETLATAEGRANGQTDSDPASQPLLSEAGSASRSAPNNTAEPASAPQAVRFTAPLGVSIEKDPQNPARRIAIAQGEPGKPIILQQGPADSDDYLTLRSTYAVVFSRSDLAAQDKDQQVPYAPPVVGMGEDGEKISGVYLEGDVIIQRGERQMTAEAAYYDFAHEKAVILKPVFRTIQEQRNIPIYIRAQKARVLSPRETKFRDAVVSTSDFHTPTYSLNAKEVTFRDETPYDKEGDRLGERSYSTRYESGWFDIRGVPVAYLPKGNMEFTQGHSPLRTASIGSYGDFGLGVETEWHLFRLLGLVKPEGFDARLNANYYEKGALLGVDGDYERREGNRDYSGYFSIDGVYDRKREDTFGEERKDIPVAHNERGRILARHKEFLPRDWQIQGELSLLSDQNFLEEFYPNEFWTGKEQENLIYARKQRDNWAVTALLKARLNDFLTQTESFPEVAGYLTGQPLLGDRLTYFGEARMGGKRYRDADTPDPSVRSDMMARFDTRHEIDLPLEIPTAFGPLNIVPYLAGRFTYWSDQPDEQQRLVLGLPRQNRRATYQEEMRSLQAQGVDMQGGRARHTRFYGEVGARANMHFWRVYNDVDSRLWDVHRLKHIITPELRVFASGSSVDYDKLYPMDPNVEQHIQDNSGISFGIHQRLQTKRGPAGNRRTVDWMRLNIVGGWFNQQGTVPGGGRLFFSRPEYSYQRNFIAADYTWNISDSIALLADGSYDLQDGHCDLLNIGLAVNRDERLSYYAGMRYIKEMDSAVGTIGVNYKINNKYSIRVFEQYDFAYKGGMNTGTRVTIVRKLPRWYVALTFIYDRRLTTEDEFGLMLTLWPEGVPEARIGTGRMDLLNTSSEN